MKINAVEFMRKSRDNIAKKICNMSWEEEQEFLKKHTKKFKYLFSNNNALHISDNINQEYNIKIEKK